MSTQQERKRDQRSREAGSNQRERESGGGNRGPWGHAKAPIPYESQGETKTQFVLLGAVWETEGGNLRINLDAEPNQWRDPHFRRTVVLVKNDREQGGR